MVAWSEAELDEITDEFLALMLDEREFIDLWTANVEQDLARTEAKKSVATALPSNPPPVDVSKRQDTLLPIFEELVHAVDASSQTFLSSGIRMRYGMSTDNSFPRFLSVFGRKW
ncbi:hypothetical protein ANCDUO_10808 [Ancylostoma duodenale]|uniref:Uncharacterized protein n=1 Tax=Ancylostoma duodenale TaxID=51022 RepID=A0A0C2GCZ5_9BILA|nr:hypothetical protein ANCDUO_10808 [Ancylostoma duodenale]